MSNRISKLNRCKHRGPDLVLPALTSADGKRKYPSFNFSQYARDAVRANTGSIPRMTRKRRALMQEIADARKAQQDALKRSPVIPDQRGGGTLWQRFKNFFRRKQQSHTAH